MKVYEITLDVDEFRSLLAKDDSVHEYRLLAFDGSSKVQQWTKPLETVFDNEKAPTPDIYSCGAGNMLLWGRSLEILGPKIAPVAEFLPVTWKGGSGFVVNIIGFSNCLDLERTKWCYHEASGKRLWIEQYGFVRGILPKFVPFKIEDQRFKQFCVDHEDGSENLPSIVEAHNLKGIRFDTVWEVS